MSARRLFIAVALPPAVQHAVTDVRGHLGPTLPDRSLSWVPPINLHLTLRFLGDVDEGQVQELEARLRAGLIGCKVFPARCQGVEWLPSSRRPRLLYASVKASPGVLEDLHRRVQEATAGIGVSEVARPFMAHVTLARIRDSGRRLAFDGSRVLEPVRHSDFGSWRVEGCQLMGSDLRPEGARYEVLRDFPLEPGMHPEPGKD